MGFFDKFRKKKKQEEDDEAVLSQQEEQSAETADSDYPGEAGENSPEQTSQTTAYGESEAFPEQEYAESQTSPVTPEEADAPEMENEPEIPEIPEEEQNDLPDEQDTEPEDLSAEAADKKPGLFEKLKQGLKKTKDGFMSKLELLMNSFTKIDEDFFDELEETLILSDIGAETSMNICEQLRSAVKRTGATDPADVKQLLRDIISEMLTGGNELILETKPSVIMVIGVNGAGKTTTIGKLAANLKAQGKKVVVAAADTFRAAAIDQLNVWTDRAGVDIVKHSEGSDPAAVIFDAITAAKARGADVVLCDTAGRLHNKKNLMEELKKIARVISRELPGASVETLLVLDATTGQNAVNQAKLFSESAEITGIVLTKLDGTAKGGIIIPIKNELGIPVKLVGVGEKIDDLQPFIPADYVQALFE